MTFFTKGQKLSTVNFKSICTLFLKATSSSLLFPPPHFFFLTKTFIEGESTWRLFLEVLGPQASRSVRSVNPRPQSVTKGLKWDTMAGAPPASQMPRNCRLCAHVSSLRPDLWTHRQRPQASRPGLQRWPHGQVSVLGGRATGQMR